MCKFTSAICDDEREGEVRTEKKVLDQSSGNHSIRDFSSSSSMSQNAACSVSDGMKFRFLIFFNIPTERCQHQAKETEFMCLW